MPRLIHDHTDPYQRRFTFPKWNGAISVVHEPRLFRYLPEFRAWTRAQHEAQARQDAAGYLIVSGLYGRKVRAALKKYGDHGPLISGVVREHFPESTKTMLRNLARWQSHLGDRARAHWQAAGRRLHTYRRLIGTE